MERKGRKQDWTEGQTEAEMLALVLTPLGATEIEKKKVYFRVFHIISKQLCLYIPVSISL